MNYEQYHQDWDGHGHDCAPYHRVRSVDVGETPIERNHRWSQAGRCEEKDLALKIQDRSRQEEKAAQDECSSPQLVESLQSIRHGEAPLRSGQFRADHMVGTDNEASVTRT